MSQYTPLDNDNDCAEFDVERIEQMEVEFETCGHCRGHGIVTNALICITCPKCHGTGDIPKTKEG